MGKIQRRKAVPFLNMHPVCKQFSSEAEPCSRLWWGQQSNPFERIDEDSPMVSSLLASRICVSQILAAVLRLAAEHHRAGRRAEAASLYREVLGMDARNADALFLLGVLAREEGRLEEAQRLLAEAGRWAASRVQVDAERGLVEKLLERRRRRPVAGGPMKAEPAKTWVSRVMPPGDGCALAAIAHA
jgi:tetratricopeptide (TPR) repeat protein